MGSSFCHSSTLLAFSYLLPNATVSTSLPAQKQLSRSSFQSSSFFSYPHNEAPQHKQKKCISLPLIQSSTSPVTPPPPSEKDRFVTRIATPLNPPALDSLSSPSKLSSNQKTSQPSLQHQYQQQQHQQNTQKSQITNSEPKEPLNVIEKLQTYVRNTRQAYFDLKDYDRAITADNSLFPNISELTVKPFMFFLHQGFELYGSVFKFAVGPRAFYIISDPVIIRHILRDAPDKYDKGILAEVLEPIMGKGLIPADFETWKRRRRAIVPGFHARWLQRMVTLFGDCTQHLTDKLDTLINQAQANTNNDSIVTDMEAQYCSVALDIIGLSVFNYEFGSVTRESPVIQAVYRLLRETEHRSMSLIPYWKIPGVSYIVPRQIAFKRDINIVNDTLDTLIQKAVDSKLEADIEELESRDYSRIKDPSLLRFLVDSRGEEATCSQLRDDLMTLLIAGHETTAAVLNWATFLLAQNTRVLVKVQKEIDTVLGPDRLPTFEDMKKLQYLRLVIAETLRLYPAPPLLLRRALEEDELPQGGSDTNVRLFRGAEIFISVWSLHRSPHLWENPEKFEPERFTRPFENPGVKDWKGYVPGREGSSSLNPNEVSSDFAFLPFGGGSRKCIGDQFAMMESLVILAMVLRKFNFTLASSPEEVFMQTGATIHTRDGLRMVVSKRKPFEYLDPTHSAYSSNGAVHASNGKGMICNNQ